MLYEHVYSPEGRVSLDSRAVASVKEARGHQFSAGAQVEGRKREFRL